MKTVFDFYEQYVRDEPNNDEKQKEQTEENEKLFDTLTEEAPNNEESEE